MDRCFIGHIATLDVTEGTRAGISEIAYVRSLDDRTRN
jgi:hypothetical protein